VIPAAHLKSGQMSGPTIESSVNMQIMIEIGFSSTGIAYIISR
jgi:hypothetical protein